MGSPTGQREGVGVSVMRLIPLRAVQGHLYVCALLLATLPALAVIIWQRDALSTRMHSSDLWDEGWYTIGVDV